MTKLDPHIHSCYSPDSYTKIEDIIKKAVSLNIDIIAISDHNTVEGSKVAVKETKNRDDILVIPSIEISSKKGHILGFGCEEKIPEGLDSQETIDRIRDQGGLAIIPHPYCYYRHGLLHKINYKTLDFDAIEVKNARFIIGYCNRKAENISKYDNIPGLGSSDAHYVEFIGDCYTEIQCEKDIDSVMKAIKKGKVKAQGKGTSNIELSRYLYHKHIH